VATEIRWQRGKGLTNLAEPDRGFLGLTHNPFVQSDEGFFEQADRKSHLEQLRHLSQWSRRVLLVTGPAGVGKTALYRQLSATLEPRCKAARIHGGLLNASREVLLAVARGFGIAAPADANTQLLTELIREHVDDQARAERVCVVLVDDADHLEPKALVDLMTLARDCRVQLAFFAEVRLVPAVERAAGRLGLGWHEIRLTGFSEPQTREYLEWRFKQARYRGRLPFTDAQVKEIHRASEGLPGKINQLANVVLVKLQTGDIGKAEGMFPAVHRALLLLLVVVVGLLYLLWQQGGEPGDAVTGDDVRVAGSAVPDAAGAEVGAGSVAAADAERAAGADAPAEDAELTRRLADPRTESAAEPDAELEPAVDAPVVSPAEEEAVEAAEQPVSETTVATASTEEASAPEVVAGVRESAQAAAEEEAPPEPRAAKPPAPKSQESPRPAAKPARAPAPIAAGARDGRWLLAQPPDSYTLQLVTVSSAESVAGFISKQPDPSRFASYQLARDGRILYVVCYGTFATRSEAEAASRQLPATVGSVKPWIRTLAQVHGAIRTTPQ